jgi:hypothetical protein
MEKITITIDVCNAAFDFSAAEEVSRILEKLAVDIKQGSIEPCRIRDICGNTVGELTIK